MNQIKILYLLARSRINQQGTCPIRCRITSDYERKEFSTGIFISPNFWDAKKQLAKPPSEENKQINTELSLITNKINQAFLFLKVKEEPFSVHDIYSQYKGVTLEKEFGIVEYFKLYLERLKKLVGIEIKEETYEKFEYIMHDSQAFIKFHYRKADIKLKNLDYSFISDFEYYYKTQKLHKQVTINKSLQRFKKVIKQAVIGGHLASHPFEEHKGRKVIPTIVFLTHQELQALEDKEFASSTLNHVKDCYLFCCYTGLAYREMFELRKEDLITKLDGTVWIYKKRQKTDRAFSVPLVLPKAIQILEKYSNEGEYMLPRISNQSFNRLLKEIAITLEIDKKLTHHTARKTFATTVLLDNEIPMEVVSKLLGHKKITTTQEYYAEVMPERLSKELIKLKSKINATLR